MGTLYQRNNLYAKRQQPQQKALEKADEKPAATLPPPESLTPESDFSAFMGPKVKDELRRVALKKLFSDPHFNAADPFEPFTFSPAGAAVYQLGQFGTAARKLKELDVKP
jgi:hypothetical protein